MIFLSALSEAEDRVKGFRVGAVDYIPKPFEIEEVQARVETHLKLRRAQQVERDLLERTLGGAVTALWELVQLTSPVLALRSRAIREIVCWIATRVPTRDPWQCELAATLCLVGVSRCPTRSSNADMQAKIFRRTRLKCSVPIPSAQPSYSQVFHAWRLWPKSSGIKRVLRERSGGHDNIGIPGREARKARRLHPPFSIWKLDRRIHRGVGCCSAVAQLRSSGRFDGAILDALDSCSPTPANFEALYLPIAQIRAGMVLAEDVWTNDGRLLILKKGTDLTPTWIERLENFAKARGLQQRLCVRIEARLSPIRTRSIDGFITCRRYDASIMFVGDDYRTHVYGGASVFIATPCGKHAPKSDYPRSTA